MNSNDLVQPESLTDVADAFAHWRASRTRRGPTPEALQRQAVALLDKHVAFHICQALQINGAMLKQWNVRHGADRGPATVLQSDSARQAAPFVELPANLPVSSTPDQDIPSTPSTLNVQWPNATRLSVTTELSTCELLVMLHSLPVPLWPSPGEIE